MSTESFDNNEAQQVSGSAEIPEVTLNDGNSLPAIGFGTYSLNGEAGAVAVTDAIHNGYRLLDTAVNYDNEGTVGAGVRAADIDRSLIKVTSKLPGRYHEYQQALDTGYESRWRLGLDSIDLYLIHWPNPQENKYVEAWKALIELQKRGVVKSIGVSNFTQEHLERIIDETGVVPAINQIELHPYFPQEELLTFHGKHNIVTEAWSPLGKANAPYNEPAVKAAAENHGVTSAQVILRWHLQRGSLPIPKSGNPERQRENLDVFGFELTKDEISAITALGKPDGRWFDGDPNTHQEF